MPVPRCVELLEENRLRQRPAERAVVLASFDLWGSYLEQPATESQMHFFFIPSVLFDAFFLWVCEDGILLELGACPLGGRRRVATFPPFVSVVPTATARPPPTIMRLVLRRPDKRNRFLVRPLAVPADNKLSAEQQRRKDEQEKQEQEEREDLKRFVMDHVNRSAEEEEEREGCGGGAAGPHSGGGGGGGSRYSYASSASSTPASFHHKSSLATSSAAGSNGSTYHGGAEGFSGSAKSSSQVSCPSGVLTSAQYTLAGSSVDVSQRRKAGRGGGGGGGGARGLRTGRKR